MTDSTVRLLIYCIHRSEHRISTCFTMTDSWKKLLRILGMKKVLIDLLAQSIAMQQASGVLPPTTNAQKLSIQLTATRDGKHGDFASNIALILAKRAKLKPMKLAKHLVRCLPSSDHVEKVAIAAPGFINFFIKQSGFEAVVPDVLKQGRHYGESNLGKGKCVHMEFVSANPTGPLHIGHGRGAAYGACVANLLKFIGFKVHCEYYVNDAGRQMRILALSVWLRYLQTKGERVRFPDRAYQGNYIIDIAKQLLKKRADCFYRTQASIERLLPPEIDSIQDNEKYIDAYVKVARTVLGETTFNIILKISLHYMLSDIQNDLSEFGVIFDAWFYESTLAKKGLIAEGIRVLEKHGYVYDKDGARWFQSTNFGDEKDRVLIRQDGEHTYFAADIAYHLHKYREGYDRILDFFGADHHGYIPRINGFLKGLREEPKRLTVLLVQFAILYRGKEKVSMSTRSDLFIRLRDLRHEVGNDAARFFYIMRKPEQHLEFDLKLAASESHENPVYYIQYAYARICSVWRRFDEKKLTPWNKEMGLKKLSLLTSPYEKALMRLLARYPEVVQNAAWHYAPHKLAYFLIKLANAFHVYYNAEKFLVDPLELREARLCLMAAVQNVLASSLRLLGVSAPDRMKKTKD